MGKISFWDFLAYLALAFLIVYFLLKVLGIIQSPIQIDIIAVISASYFIGRYAMKINFMSDEIKNIKEEIKIIKKTTNSANNY